MAALHKKPDVVTLDYSLPDLSCEKLIKEVKNFNPEIPIIIVSGQEDVSTAVNLLKEGIYDYIVKDDDTKDRLWVTLKNLKEKVNLKEELNTLREEVQEKYDFSNILKGNSSAMQRIFKMMENLQKQTLQLVLQEKQEQEKNW